MKPHYLKKRQESFDKVKEWIDQILEPQKYGFKESYQHIANKPLYIIYDSQWCRVRFSEAPGDRWAQKPNIYIRYGRLHAPNSGGTINWRGKECLPWWNGIFKTVSFLEGIPPKEYAQEHLKPDFLELYWGKVLQTKDGNAKEMLELHRAVWKHYEKRLFELFDLRHPKLWNHFREYVKEYYKFSGWKQLPYEQYPFPAPWEIC